VYGTNYAHERLVEASVLFTLSGFEMGSTFQGCVEDMSKSFRSSDLSIRLASIKCLAELAEGAGVSGRFVHVEILKVLKSAATVSCLLFNSN
jgi:hypothetical protein